MQNHFHANFIHVNINAAILHFKLFQGPLEDNPVVEVHLEHPLLQSSVQMVVPPTGNLKNLREVLHELFETTTPIVLYGIAGDNLSEEVTCLDFNWLCYSFLCLMLLLITVTLFTTFIKCIGCATSPNDQRFIPKATSFLYSNANIRGDIWID